MSSNDKSSFNFDLDDILSEFSSLDEEPVSEKPVFEPSEPLTDLSEKDDELFSAVINDGIEEAPAQEVYDFDPELIAKEFASEDSFSESTAALDPESIRREFASDGSAAPSPAPHREDREEKPCAVPPDTDELLSEVDLIIAEFKHDEKAAEQIIEPEHASEPSEPEPTKRREPEMPSPAEPPEEAPEPEAEPTKLRIDDAPAQEPEPDLYEGSGISEDTEDKYAADADYTVIEPEPPKKEKVRREHRSLRESVAVPLISALAFIAMKIKQSQVTLGETSYETEELGEEMPPDKA